jgi:hypothetical protein
MLNSFVNSRSVLHFEHVNLAFAPKCSNLVNLSRQFIKVFGPLISNETSNERSLKGSNVGDTCLHVVHTKSLNNSPTKFQNLINIKLLRYFRIQTYP